MFHAILVVQGMFSVSVLDHTKNRVWVEVTWGQVKIVAIESKQVSRIGMSPNRPHALSSIQTSRLHVTFQGDMDIDV